MKEVTKKIEIRKGGDITVLQEALWDDEVYVEEQEGDSLLGAFLNILNMMTRMNLAAPSVDMYSFADGWGPDDMNITQCFSDIQSIDASSSPIRITFSDGDILNTSQTVHGFEGVMLGGITGNSDLNGVHISDATKIDDQTVDISVSTTGNEDISFAAGLGIFDTTQSGRAGSFGGMFNNPTLLLGASSLSNKTTQIGLNNPIVPGNATGQMNYGSVNLNAPVVDLNQQISTITVSRDVTNNATTSLDVEEVAFACEMIEDNNSPQENAIIGRDLLSTSVPAKTTVTFNYKFRTTGQSSGAILAHFNELIYRNMSEGNRTVQDTENADQTDSNSNQLFNGVAGGGYERPLGSSGARGGSFNRGHHVGIQVGLSSQDVDIADFDLKNRLDHGKSTNEILYRGQSIHPTKLDNANDRYYFDVVRYFENKSGASLDVKEVGYNVAPENDQEYKYPAQIFRHLVEPSVSVSNGSTLKVTYRVIVKPKA